MRCGLGTACRCGIKPTRAEPEKRASPARLPDGLTLDYGRTHQAGLRQASGLLVLAALHYRKSSLPFVNVTFVT